LNAKDRLNIVVAGKRGDYFVWTLATWCRELRDFLEEELGYKVTVEVREEDAELPRLYVNGILVLEGVPGEEGYLIEILKHFVEKAREKGII